MSNMKFAEKNLIDNYRIARFVVPLGILGIVIPGSISVSLKSALELNVELEKEIDFELSYSKHIKFSLPFEYRGGRMNYPNPSNMVNIYGSQKLSPDFSQFKQIPKFGAVYTITPVLAVKW